MKNKNKKQGVDELRRAIFDLSEDDSKSTTISIDDVIEESTQPDEPLDEPEITETVATPVATEETDEVFRDEAPQNQDEIPLSGDTIPLALDAEVAILIIDFIMPSVMVGVMSKLGYSVDKRSMQLTAKERTMLNKPVQTYLNTLDLSKLKPWQVLAISVISVYGGKAILADKQKAKKKQRQ